jgi:hypothetical protein
VPQIKLASRGGLVWRDGIGRIEPKPKWMGKLLERLSSSDRLPHNIPEDA